MSQPVPPPVDTSVCPYCGSGTAIHGAELVYGGRAGFGQVLVCLRFPECDAYVGLHRGTEIPKGTLANRILREWRKLAHHAFDPLWQSGRMNRRDAYRRLAGLMGIKPGQTHIAWFTVEQCERAIAALTAAQEVA